jgi:hypothetical protein
MKHYNIDILCSLARDELGTLNIAFLIENGYLK